MDLRRLRAGERILALSGVALLVSLFLPWYGENRTGWEALALNDVILAVVALGALGAVAATLTQRAPAVAIALEAMITLTGFVAVVLVLVRTVWPAGADDGRQWGLWLALAGAIGVAAGGWVAARDERMAGAPPPADIEPLPAPRT
jgi:heme A synthase